MHLEIGTATIELPRSTVLQKPRYRDRFFLGMAVAAAVTMLLGFARTYYLKTRGIPDVGAVSAADQSDTYPKGGVWSSCVT